MPKKDNELYWYFVIVLWQQQAFESKVELIQIKCEHIKIGYLDLYSKRWKIKTNLHPKISAKKSVLNG